MTLFAECDACKLARSFDPKTPLCSGCRNNKAVIDVAARQVACLEGIVEALAALLAREAVDTDSATRKRRAKVLADLTALQQRTHNTGLTDDVQAIIDGIEP